MLDDATRQKFIVRAKSQQQTDFSQIEKLVRRRGITKLFHFTHVDNLESILIYGIKSRCELGIEDRGYEKTDPDRYDGFLEGFCVSLSKPNVFLYNTKARETSFNLIVLEIAANTLLTQSFVAFPTNASDSTSRNGVKNNPDRYLGYQGLSGLFLGKSFRNKLRLSENEPTDLQSEVLFFESIDPSKIIKIHVPPKFPVNSRPKIDEIRSKNPKMPFEYVCTCGILDSWSGEFRKYSIEWEKDGK